MCVNSVLCDCLPTHTHIHIAPNAPARVTVLPGSIDPYQSVDISWELPSQPNGELVSCTIRESGASSSNIVLGVDSGILPPTSHSLSNRLPGVTYFFTVFCSNDLDGAMITGSGATMVGGEC